MSNIKKLMASAAGGAGLNVEEVFSTYVWKSTGLTTRAIRNGIDLATEGGAVWVKSRTNAENWIVTDTERGLTKGLFLNQTYAEDTDSTAYMRSFNADGFNTGESAPAGGTAGQKYASWTFRKAPKFFDVQTWTGNGTAGRTISHNLGSEPGMIIVKRRNTADAWYVYHRDMNSTAPEDYYMQVQTYFGPDYTDIWSNTAPTDSNFTLGSSTKVNGTGSTYVAYLFAHNDGDGEFGPNGDADIIKCGSYTGNSSQDGPEIDLGFEPQWLLVKGVGSHYWELMDTMRGMPTLYSGSNTVHLRPSETNSEVDQFQININPTGFKIFDSASQINQAGRTYIYMAIRRPTGIPESGTDFFGLTSGNEVSEPYFNSDWPVDFALKRNTQGDNWVTATRLCGPTWLRTNDNNNENTDGNIKWDYNNGWWGGYAPSYIKSWMWRRAPSCFDVVTYRGTNGTTTINHNLGVVPEMMWFKTRNDFDSWVVYHKDAGNTGGFTLNSFGGFLPSSGYFNNTSPTDSVFTVSTDLNFNSIEYVAYLFASLNGVSKVGSYTGNGSSQTIDCGFSSGARFVLIKRTAPSGNWYVWDTQRGIVSANDPHLALNLSDGQVTTNDSIDPVSSGFAVNQVSATDINLSSTEYIFYAIA